jgi:hypothetical protein
MLSQYFPAGFSGTNAEPGLWSKINLLTEMKTLFFGRAFRHRPDSGIIR